MSPPTRHDSSQPGIPFPGRERLIDGIDAALACGDAHAVTAALRSVMCTLIQDPQVQLPACAHAPVSDRYARRELYRSPEHGYSVVAMTWGPGQGTPLHDHCGLWCVEGVWHGALDITQYELLERDGQRSRFRTAGSIQAGSGSAGSLIPPHEYHTIRNPDESRIAISLHVYQGPMEHCARFIPQADGWHLRDETVLCVDQTS